MQYILYKQYKFICNTGTCQSRCWSVTTLSTVHRLNNVHSLLGSHTRAGMLKYRNRSHHAAVNTSIHTGNTKLHISNNTCSTSLQHTVLQSTLHSIQICAGVLCRDMEDLCLYVPIRTRIYPTAHVSSKVYITIVLYTLDINKMAAYSTRIYPTAHVSSEGYITFATSTTSLT